MTETKKKVVRKTTTKNTAPKEEVKKEIISARKKRIEIDRNEMIPCRSVTNGALIYISDRTRARYLWREYGTVLYIDMGELLDMRASQPVFLNDVLFVIDDEEAAEYLGLTRKYESLGGLDDLDAFFKQSYDELREVIPKLPKGIKHTLATRARQLIENKELANANIIDLLEKHLNVELWMFRN